MQKKKNFFILFSSRSQRGYEKSDYRTTNHEQVIKLYHFIFKFLQKKNNNRNDRMQMNMVEINHRKIVSIKILNQNSINKIQKNRKLLQIRNRIMKNH